MSSFRLSVGFGRPKFLHKVKVLGLAPSALWGPKVLFGDPKCSLGALIALGAQDSFGPRFLGPVLKGFIQYLLECGTVGVGVTGFNGCGGPGMWLVSAGEVGPGCGWCQRVWWAWDVVGFNGCGGPGTWLVSSGVVGPGCGCFYVRWKYFNHS